MFLFRAQPRSRASIPRSVADSGVAHQCWRGTPWGRRPVPPNVPGAMSGGLVPGQGAMRRHSPHGQCLFRNLSNHDRHVVSSTPG